MKRLSAPFGTTLIVLLAAAASQSRADYLTWSYTTALPTGYKGVTVGSPTNGGASVSLTAFTPAPPATGYSGGTSIPVLAYVDSPTVPPAGVNFTGSTPYNLALTITDGTSHDSATLNFTGTLSGLLTQTTSSVLALLGPTSLVENGVSTPTTSNSFTLDGHTYTVNIAPLTLLPPTNPQTNQLNPQTNIMASVSVSDASQGGNPPPLQGAPEPTSLVLGGLGFSCVGVGCWWKRLLQRRRRPQQPHEDA